MSELTASELKSRVLAAINNGQRWRVVVRQGEDREGYPVGYSFGIDWAHEWTMNPKCSGTWSDNGDESTAEGIEGFVMGYLRFIDYGSAEKVEFISNEERVEVVLN